MSSSKFLTPTTTPSIYPFLCLCSYKQHSTNLATDLLMSLSSRDSSTSQSDSSNDEWSSLEEEEEEEEVRVTPKFISKRKDKKTVGPNTSGNGTSDETSDERKRAALLSRLDNIQEKGEEKTEDSKESDIHQVDDTDDLDPELEYENWKQRERARFLRDHSR